MKEYEDIETMFSRFRLLYLAFKFWKEKKNNIPPDCVKKILRSLPTKWRPKVTTIEEIKNLNKLNLDMEL